MLPEQGKETVRGGARDDLKCACSLQLSERREQIAFPFIDKKTTAFGKQAEIESRQLSQPDMMTIAFSFALCQIDQEIEMSHVTLAQKRVLQHGA